MVDQSEKVSLFVKDYMAIGQSAKEVQRFLLRTQIEDPSLQIQYRGGSSVLRTEKEFSAEAGLFQQFVVVAQGVLDDLEPKERQNMDSDVSLIKGIAERLSSERPKQSSDNSPQDSIVSVSISAGEAFAISECADAIMRKFALPECDRVGAPQPD